MEWFELSVFVSANCFFSGKRICFAFCHWQLKGKVFQRTHSSYLFTRLTSETWCPPGHSLPVNAVCSCTEHLPETAELFQRFILVFPILQEFTRIYKSGCMRLEVAACSGKMFKDTALAVPYFLLFGWQAILLYFRSEVRFQISITKCTQLFESDRIDEVKL